MGQSVQVLSRVSVETHSRRAPTISGELALDCFTMHDNEFSLMQLQNLSSGVGGRVELARRELDSAGQSVLLAVTDDLGGELGGELELYWVARRVKSSDTVTLDTFSALS